MSIEKKYGSVVKPLFDKIAALILLFICLPIGLLIAIILVLLSKETVLFSHTRIGKNEELFNLYKFRTMNSASENGAVKVTGFGKVLRMLSLDELPQLVNVVKGEMSLVGPRPLLVEYLPFYTEVEKRRHKVVPGITGWAQVHGRNQSDWKTRMENDCYYTEHISFFLDLKILFLTFIQLFKFKQADFVSQKQETFITYAKRR